MGILHMPQRDKLFLLVDDEPDMCWALEHLLSQHGFVSRRALSGREALGLTEAGARLFAFVDAKLPDMEGLEVAAKMREINPAIQIVMVSGYFYKDDRTIREALQEGLINAFISKPFSHAEILETIKNLGALPP